MNTPIFLMYLVIVLATLAGIIAAHAIYLLYVSDYIILSKLKKRLTALVPGSMYTIKIRPEIQKLSPFSLEHQLVSISALKVSDVLDSKTVDSRGSHFAYCDILSYASENEPLNIWTLSKTYANSDECSIKSALYLGERQISERLASDLSEAQRVGYVFLIKEHMFWFSLGNVMSLDFVPSSV